MKKTNVLVLVQVLFLGLGFQAVQAEKTKEGGEVHLPYGEPYIGESMKIDDEVMMRQAVAAAQELPKLVPPASVKGDHASSAVSWANIAWIFDNKQPNVPFGDKPIAIESKKIGEEKCDKVEFVDRIGYVCDHFSLSVKGGELSILAFGRSRTDQFARIRPIKLNEERQALLSRDPDAFVKENLAFLWFQTDQILYDSDGVLRPENMMQASGENKNFKRTQVGPGIMPTPMQP